MNEPITTLDPRNSGPGAVVTPWEETRRVLETAELFWLSTVRADGRPHVTPLVAVWHDGAIHFTAKETAQKTANLRGNPHVILTTGYNQIGGFSVVVEGDAVQTTDQDTLERLASVWATKWDGSWPFQVRNGFFAFTMKTNNTLSPIPTSCSLSNPPRSSHSAEARPATSSDVLPTKTLLTNIVYNWQGKAS